MMYTGHSSVLAAIVSNGGRMRVDRSRVVGNDNPQELIVRFSDVARLMRDGDGFWFRGERLHSKVIMMFTGSNVSHCGLIDRTGLLSDHDGVKIVDIVEGIGGRHLNFIDEIRKYPGQYYWSPVRPQWLETNPATELPWFDRHGAITEARRLIGTKYGRAAVALQALTRCPFSREIMFLMQNKVDMWMEGKQPFCSMGQKNWCTIGGGLDPVPGRSSWLTTPQDTWQSMLWVPEKYALIP